jgi:hypothetical protein
VLHANGSACPRAGYRPNPKAGFNGLFEIGRTIGAGCLALVRRKFFFYVAAVT